MDELETILHSRIVDEVAICLPFAMEELIEQAAHLCEQEGKVVRIPVAPVERVLSLGQLETIDGLGVYSLANGPDRALSLLVKRVVDIAGSVLLLAVLSPVFALVAMLIKLDSPGPVLFRQPRVGLHGRLFNVVKFRSMCADAEDQLEELREHNEIQGHAFKLEQDPRVTPIGRFLRKSSLDELPQLWNVLRSEMSLVGPRPPLTTEVAQYDVWHRRSGGNLLRSFGGGGRIGRLGRRVQYPDVGYSHGEVVVNAASGLSQQNRQHYGGRVLTRAGL